MNFMSWATGILRIGLIILKALKRQGYGIHGVELRPFVRRQRFVVLVNSNRMLVRLMIMLLIHP